MPVQVLTNDNGAHASPMPMPVVPASHASKTLSHPKIEVSDAPRSPFVFALRSHLAVLLFCRRSTPSLSPWMVTQWIRPLHSSEASDSQSLESHTFSPSSGGKAMPCGLICMSFIFIAQPSVADANVLILVGGCRLTSQEPKKLTTKSCD